MGSDVTAQQQTTGGASSPFGQFVAISGEMRNPAAQVGPQASRTLLELQHVHAWYGNAEAIRNISITIRDNLITAIVGPSGSGKSTLLRVLNRTLELTPHTRVTGRVMFDGINLYGSRIDPVEVRKQIGIASHTAVPFSMSVYDNLAYGLRNVRAKGNRDDLIERALRETGLWDEVKLQLSLNSLLLSRSQQQRLCLARVIAMKPKVILMDDPCSGLDPIATQKIENLLYELAFDYTVLIVTTDVSQAARISNKIAVMVSDSDESGNHFGRLIEYDDTPYVLTTPKEERTERFIFATERTEASN